MTQIAPIALPSGRAIGAICVICVAFEFENQLSP